MKPKHFTLTFLLVLTLAATIPKRYLFSTTSIDSMAPTTLGTNVIAQTNAAGVRTLLNITNATGLEATAANLTTVSNAQTTTAANLTTVSNTVASQANTLATNTALLNGTNTFSGANTFPAAGFYPANGLVTRLLWSCPTNIIIGTMAESQTAWTNAGDWKNVATTNPASVLRFTIPPLLGSNSQLAFRAVRTCTNANLGSGNSMIYIGPNTNYMGYTATFTTAAGSANLYTINNAIFTSAASWTNQLTTLFALNNYNITNYCNTAVSNDIYLSFWSNAGRRTNDVIVGFEAIEIYAP